MKLAYSAKAKEQIRILPPPVKQEIKLALESLLSNPYAGKPLQRELSGFWTCAVKRYRIIYAIDSKIKSLLVFHVAHRDFVYESVLVELGIKS